MMIWSIWNMMNHSVKRRETFYLAGYDPRGARQYHNFYKREAALQEKINGMSMDISTRKRTNAHIHSWKIKSTIEDNNKTFSTETHYHLLEWDDIIRKRWKKNIFSLFKDLFYIIKHYVFSGIIFKYAKIAPTQMIAAFYPVIYLFSLLFFSYIIFSFVVGFLTPFITLLPSLGIASLLAYSFIRLFMHIGNKMAVFWLLRIYVFALEYVYKRQDDLEFRIKEFSDYIKEAILNAEKNDIDEILIVSHSVGTIMTIPILAEVFNSEFSQESLKKISIMTLGECIPIVSFLPDAHAYHEDMKKLTLIDNLCWLDYTTPIDGACFPLMDYYKYSGLTINDDKKPLYLSPRFHTLFSSENYAKLRKNRYLTHFVYLQATDYVGNYDFFKMTAGPERLCSYIGVQNNE